MHDNSELIERIETLERQNRRIKRVGLAVIAGFGAVLFLGAGGDKPEVLDEIRVKKLVVEDNAGTERCVIDVGTDGSTNLTLNDRRGQKRIETRIQEPLRRAFLNVFQSDGKIRIGAGCDDGGLSWVNVINVRGQTRGVNSGR